MQAFSSLSAQSHPFTGPRHWLSLAIVLTLGACSSSPPLMPTPNIYLENGYVDSAIPAKLRSQHLNLIYVTDRAPEASEKDNLAYGSKRSASLAWGNIVVQLGYAGLDWPKIVQSSSSDSKKERPRYFVNSLSERGRFPASPYPFEISDDTIVLKASVAKSLIESKNRFSSDVNDRLSQSARKDVIMFVHGFNNSLEDASFTLAGIWHFLQRQGVPIVYSWPAAHGGLTGYFTDRESGEYTVFHLKETIRLLSAMPGIQNIHIIAHSRGTDVTTSALRELIIESRAAGKNPGTALKIANLVLAAPDLDFGVIRQRLMAEQFGPAFGQITIYTSEKDKALGISQFLMSGLRFGRLKSTDIAHDDRDIFKRVGNVSFINVKGNSSFIGHGYFHQNPAASSDLLRLMQTQARPGSALRPLKHVENNFWELAPEYLSHPAGK